MNDDSGMSRLFHWPAVTRGVERIAELADEVGLGKTIEAIMVLREYQLRAMARRVLVLAPPALVQPEVAAPSEPASSLFSPSAILEATTAAGWKAFGTDSASAAEGLSRHVYALRRGDQRLQMQVYVTQSNADANRMGVETRPPAVSVVLGEKLVRLVPPPNGDAATAIELARDLTAFRNRTR